jgi:hypothetical protein
MSKIAEDTYGAAGSAVSLDGHTKSLPQVVKIVVQDEMEICDVDHR